MNKSVMPKNFVSFFNPDHLSLWSSSSEPLRSIDLPGKCIDALAAQASKTTDANFQHVRLSDVPGCKALIEEIRAVLFDGAGCLVVDRFPVESFDVSVNRRVAGILSNLISPLMSQDVAGTLLYDVVDAGTKKQSTTRRSKTNESQPFHTDGPWHTVPPRLIGLFCIQPAEQGGFSQVSSLQNALSRLVERLADKIESSTLDLPWNKMGEFEDGELPYSKLPILDSANGQVFMRHYADYVRSAYELSGEVIPDTIHELLTEIEVELTNTACAPFRLEAGQLQYVNNWTVAHARAGFDDNTSASAQAGRHLVRIWNSEHKANGDALTI